MIEDLSRINHEIDTLELVTAKHKEEIVACNEKVQKKKTHIIIMQYIFIMCNL